MRGWTGGGAGIRDKGVGDGVKGAGRGGGDGERGVGDGGREDGRREIFWGGGFTKICCILLIFLYFYVLKCNKWVSEVSNRRIEVNSAYNESGVDFTSPTRSVPPTVVYIDFVYVRFQFISS